MLTIKALNQFYGGSHTLWDVDLAVSPGSRMCLMGRNGMGKTTLLKCIMGLQPASSGGIAFDGSDLLRRPAEQRARLEVYGDGILPDFEVAGYGTDEKADWGKLAPAAAEDLAKEVEPTAPKTPLPFNPFEKAKAGDWQTVLQTVRATGGNPR